MSAIDRPLRPRTALRPRAVVAVASGIAALLLGFWPSAAFADSVRRDQWQIRELDARSAWALSNGEGVTVAVIDSGVDATHPDLIGQVLPGADFVDGTSDGRVDPVGHGTTVAALIAGRDDDSSGVVGLAPHAKILPVRVLDKNNKYDDPAVVAKGITWAVDHGATVINLSLGGQLRSDVLAEALAYAAEHDVVVIACTGNVAAGSASREVWYPAREAGVIAVAGLVGLVGTEAAPAPVPSDRPVAGGGGGSGSSESLWTGSLTGAPTVLTAPAVNLLGAKAGGGYWRVQGTSFAAPLVAATASLIRSRYPTMTAPNVINRLISTARDLGKPGRDDQYGYGEVDPVAALRAEVIPIKANPLGEVPPPPPAAAPATKSSGQGSDVPGHPAAASASPAPEQATDGMGLAARAAAMERRLGPSAAIGSLVAAALFGLGLLLTRRQRPAPRHLRRR